MILGGGAVTAATAMAAAMLAARREKISFGAWLVRTLALHMMVRARKRTLKALHQQIY